MAQFSKLPVISDRYSLALTKAVEWHQFQVRKKGGAPYLTHLLSVSALAWEMTQDELFATAGLLHDSVEDVEIPIETIEELFGSAIAMVVWDCTKPESRLDTIYPELDCYNPVKLADSIHNARCCVAELGSIDLNKLTESDRGFYLKQIEKYERVVNQASLRFQPWKLELKRLITCMYLKLVLEK